MERLEETIVGKALEYGYESCGVIGVDEMAGFAEKLRERIKKAPGNEETYERFFRFATLSEDYPWAKSIVVCIVKYGIYRLPGHLEGLIGKHYLTDVRSNEGCKEYKASANFETYLQSLGLRVETNRMFGITSMRWAAHKAGLGIIRRNNFFYTGSGSWVHIEGFLTDRVMELKQTPALEPCPPDCSLCISACPTKSLSEPYTMSPATCISPLTVRGGELIENPNCRQMGKWIYGCDACQDACPHNAGKWRQAEDFPELEALGEALSLEKIIEMDYETLADLLSSRYFYISRDRIWQWKLNALNAMRNAYDEKYTDSIKAAQNDTNEYVRRMAALIIEEASI